MAGDFEGPVLMLDFVDHYGDTMGITAIFPWTTREEIAHALDDFVLVRSCFWLT